MGWAVPLYILCRPLMASARIFRLAYSMCFRPAAAREPRHRHIGKLRPASIEYEEAVPSPSIFGLVPMITRAQCHWQQLHQGIDRQILGAHIIQRAIRPSRT
jgi:hypothetical protein